MAKAFTPDGNDVFGLPIMRYFMTKNGDVYSITMHRRKITEMFISCGKLAVKKKSD